jgi:hypothetical protein
MPETPERFVRFAAKMCLTGYWLARSAGPIICPDGGKMWRMVWICQMRNSITRSS